jgi:hypothetical protein
MCKFSRIGCQWRGPFHEVVVKSLFTAKYFELIMHFCSNRFMNLSVFTHTEVVVS